MKPLVYNYFSFAFSLLKHVYKEVNCHCSTNDWLKTIEIGACMYDPQVWLNNQQAAWEAGSHDEPSTTVIVVTATKHYVLSPV